MSDPFDYDEDDMEVGGHGQEPGGIHDPDWGRFEVKSRAMGNTATTALGDGTRWGSQVAGTIVAPGPTSFGQTIWVQTHDPYTRNWQIVGTVTASSLAWVLPLADFIIWLEVTMGVGQALVVHQFDIRALINLAAPWYTERADNFQIVKPFVISGGLIGRQISARFVFNIPGLIPPANLPVKCAAMISPFAAGAGL